MTNDWINKWQIKKDSGKTYITSQAVDGSYGCSCPAWTLNRKECKHIKMVKNDTTMPGYTKTQVLKGGPVFQQPQAMTKEEVDAAIEEIANDNDTCLSIMEAMCEQDKMNGAPGLLAAEIKKREARKKPPTILELIKHNAMYGGV